MQNSRCWRLKLIFICLKDQVILLWNKKEKIEQTDVIQ